jgi:hypothetical protein
LWVGWASYARGQLRERRREGSWRSIIGKRPRHEQPVENSARDGNWTRAGLDGHRRVPELERAGEAAGPRTCALDPASPRAPSPSRSERNDQHVPLSRAATRRRLRVTGVRLVGASPCRRRTLGLLTPRVSLDGLVPIDVRSLWLLPSLSRRSGTGARAGLSRRSQRETNNPQAHREAHRTHLPLKG